MKNNKYKILVLSDLKNSVNSAIDSGVSLAKMIDAEIDFFYVKKATEVVESENQLSAKRTINKTHFDTDKKIKNLVAPFYSTYNQKINASFSFGNVKDEILKQIEKSKPDIIVLGKRKSSPLKIMGDNMTDFVMKNYNGSIFIAAEKNGLDPQKKLSLGVLDSMEESFNMDFAEDLISHSKKPLKAFKIVNQKSKKEAVVSNHDVVEYVFEKNDNTVSNLSNYLLKNNINLFCANRDEDTNKSKRAAIKPQFKEVINKLNVSLLLSNSSQAFA